MNSNESQSAGSGMSGIANSIVGVANKVNSSNGTLVFGAGNEVTNSLSGIYGVDDTTPLNDAKKAQDALKNAVAESDAGGAVLAIGGANKADWARKSQLIGVGNTLTGASSAVSEYNMINGYKNEVTNATHTSIIGSNNKAKNIQSTIVMGDHNTLEGRKNVISLGNNNTVGADDAVAIGNGTTVKAKSGVAIGVDSVADRAAGIEKGALGAFAPETIPTEEKSTWCSTRGAVSVGYTVGNITRQITNVAAGSEDTDAVNVAQLKKALESIDVDAGTGIKVDKIIKDGKTTYKISTNIVGSETTTDKTTVTTNQTNTGNTDTSQGTTNGTSTKTGNTVTVSTETKATSFGADNNQKADVKPGGTLNINGDGNNILTSISTSTSDNSSSIKVELKKNLNLSSVTTGDTKMDTNGVTVKDVSLTKDGLSIGNKTYVSNEGLNANDQKVTKVAAGDISATSTDAVNGSQLFATNQQVVQNAQSISKLGNRINKVGAGAAALAALHPLDFDPDDKWDFAAGYGNYNGENAVAIGAYYRPNEDTMFSVGGSFGNGENMVNAGVSLKLGQGNHVSTSKVAMAKEIKDLRKELEGLKSALLDANAGKKLDTSKLQLFPDVPKNHWAYEYVSTLKGNGVLTGYPDGEFKGDRPMTRYEFATMLYKAMLEGATLSDKILKEFAPELERFTVDTVHQDKDGKPTVERVRTVKAEK
ncbi:S-layer homology domain-containing protein [Allisonella histaminiformans]|uniref:S-layer homology domain-containing protein n=1 Tax=Allisonella histaminiformans TaxID=209880 RepID=UPI002E7989D9|nr:S-layer homology domain-containing protein [Allisonella histaminiformans]